MARLADSRLTLNLPTLAANLLAVIGAVWAAGRSPLAGDSGLAHLYAAGERTRLGLPVCFVVLRVAALPLAFLLLCFYLHFEGGSRHGRRSP